MITLYRLNDPTTSLVFYSSERSEIAGYEHSETTLSEGSFITASELEQREREAFESGFHKGAEAQDAIEASECAFADVGGLADDYLKQRKES
jgi:hypothetical protein